MEQFETTIVLGEKYTDTVTGFAGVATAIGFYLTGTPRVTLEAQRGNGIAVESFDVERVS